MTGHHFVSYSRRQAEDFALKLADVLQAGPPLIPVWLDARELPPGRYWGEEIAEAIRDCQSLLFVMTPDSVRSQSVCTLEWTRALKYKKPIVPLRLDRDAEMPFRLGGRQYIDFADDFKVGLAKLRSHLRWLASPEGELRALNDRLGDAERDLELETDPNQQQRIEDEIEVLKQQIADQRRVVENPREEEERVQKSIQTGIEREQRPEKPVSGTAHTKFINPPRYSTKLLPGSAL
jgi:TIR domain